MALHLKSRLFAPLVLLLTLLAGPSGADCPPGLDAYWTLDEAGGSLFVDQVGAAQALCENGCPLPVVGVIGGAQDFSASSSDLQSITGPALDWAADGSFSIEYWFRRDAAGFTGSEALLSRSAATSAGMWSGLGDDGRARVELIDSGGNAPLAALSGTSVLTDGLWHQIVLVRDGAESLTRLYVDAVLEGEQSFTYSATLGQVDDLLAFGWNVAAGGEYFGGSLDHLALYDRVLAPFEIIQHHTDAGIGLRGGYCAANVPLRIMPLGDSVTAGYNSINWDTDYMIGYRQKLYLDLTGLGYQVDFVGSGSSGELNPPLFDFDHEGHGGWTASMMADNVYAWLQANPADIVLLHAGTNFETTDPTPVARILDEIDRYSEDVVVVLARIINKKNPDPAFSLYNQNLQSLAETRIAAGDRILVVDQENALIYPDDMDDELHPLQTGYAKMADVWRAGLQTLLPVLAFSPPVFTSTPSTLAFLNYPYVYQATAAGMPPPQFRLIEAPTGMTVDPESGRIEWPVPVAGQYPVTIEAGSPAGTVQQSYQLTASADLILDTGDPGTSSIGSWAESGGANPYGALSLWSREVGAVYVFSAARVGYNEISLWWTEYSSRCAAVPVEIYDGTQLLGQVLVNQQQDGGRWNSLGSYDFTTTARVRILSQDTECSTNADAAMFVPREKPALDHLAIEGPARVNKNSSASYLARAYYADGSSQLVGADSWSDDSTQADISAAGLLTTYDVTGDQPCRLTASYSENGMSSSATFDLVIVDLVGLIIDNGGVGTSAVGTWSVSGGPNPYGTDSLWNRDLGAHYDYQAALNGTYEVSLWWTEWSSRCSAVPVDIYDGSLLLARVTINQLADGGLWNSVGTYDFGGSARISIVSSRTDCTTNADAVRFVPGVKPALDRLEIEGPTSVNKNSNATYSARAWYVDGSSQLVVADSWSDDSSFADISAAGVLTTLDPGSDQPCRLSAGYSENGISRSASFDLTIVSAALLILDNGDPGTSFTGTWNESGSLGFYGTNSLWSRDVGVKYTYQATVSGDYEVSLWWTEYSSRCSAVPVDIYDGSQLLNSQVINQQGSGAQWNSLGVYRFNSGARVDIRSTSADCSTNADAAQFAPASRPALDYIRIEGALTVPNNSTAKYQVRAFYVDGSSQLVLPDSWIDDSPYASIAADGTLTTLDVATDQPCRLTASYTENAITQTADFDLTISSSDILILDTGDPGTSSVGSWEESGGANPYGALSLWSREIGASYTFENSVTGDYRLDLWWTEYISRCSAVTVDIYDGSQLLETVSINQQTSGGQWNPMGQYVFTGTARAVINSNSTACSTNADAMRLVPMF